MVELVFLAVELVSELFCRLLILLILVIQLLILVVQVVDLLILLVELLILLVDLLSELLNLLFNVVLVVVRLRELAEVGLDLCPDIRNLL